MRLRRHAAHYAFMILRLASNDNTDSASQRLNLQVNSYQPMNKLTVPCIFPFLAETLLSGDHG